MNLTDVQPGSIIKVIGIAVDYNVLKRLYFYGIHPGAIGQVGLTSGYFSLWLHGNETVMRRNIAEKINIQLMNNSLTEY